MYGQGQRFWPPANVGQQWPAPTGQGPDCRPAAPTPYTDASMFSNYMMKTGQKNNKKKGSGGPAAMNPNFMPIGTGPTAVRVPPLTPPLVPQPVPSTVRMATSVQQQNTMPQPRNFPPVQPVRPLNRPSYNTCPPPGTDPSLAAIHSQPIQYPGVNYQYPNYYPQPQQQQYQTAYPYNPYAMNQSAVPAPVPVPPAPVAEPADPAATALQQYMNLLNGNPATSQPSEESKMSELEAAAAAYSKQRQQMLEQPPPPPPPPEDPVSRPEPVKNEPTISQQQSFASAPIRYTAPVQQNIRLHAPVNAYYQRQAAPVQPVPEPAVAAEDMDILRRLKDQQEKFEVMYKNWENQFNVWKEKNATHPKASEIASEWDEWRNKLLERRNQIHTLIIQCIDRIDKSTAAAAAAEKKELSGVEQLLSQRSIAHLLRDGGTEAGQSTAVDDDEIQVLETPAKPAKDPEVITISGEDETESKKESESKQLPANQSQLPVGNKSSNVSMRANDRKCFKCGVAGHFASKCPGKMDNSQHQKYDLSDDEYGDERPKEVASDENEEAKFEKLKLTVEAKRKQIMDLYMSKMEAILAQVNKQETANTGQQMFRAAQPGAGLLPTPGKRPAPNSSYDIRFNKKPECRLNDDRLMRNKSPPAPFFQTNSRLNQTPVTPVKVPMEQRRRKVPNEMPDLFPEAPKRIAKEGEPEQANRIEIICSSRFQMEDFEEEYSRPINNLYDIFTPAESSDWKVNKEDNVSSEADLNRIGDDLLERMRRGKRELDEEEARRAELAQHPQRYTIERALKQLRHPIVIILRGLIGSGKSLAAKCIKEEATDLDDEIMCRILSIDDYFMEEQETTSTENGKEVVKKKFVYKYDAKKERECREQLIDKLEETLKRGDHAVVIIDACNSYRREFESLRQVCRRFRASVIVCEMQDWDVAACFHRGVHNRSLEDIHRMKKDWFDTPSEMNALDWSFSTSRATQMKLTPQELQSKPMPAELQKVCERSDLVRKKWVK